MMTAMVVAVARKCSVLTNRTRKAAHTRKKSDLSVLPRAPEREKERTLTEDNH